MTEKMVWEREGEKEQISRVAFSDIKRGLVAAEAS